MTTELQTVEPMVAGLIRAECTCCTDPQALIGHPDLDAARLMCPVTRQIYLDRGDGLFEPEGPGSADLAPDVTSDRPVRTGPKTRIELERATFA